MKYFSKPSKPKVSPNAQVYDFAKIELPPDAADKELFKDSPSSTLETFYDSPGGWVAKRRASRRLSLEVTKKPQQELSRSSSAPFSGSCSQSDLDELDFGKLDISDDSGNYQTVRVEDSRWKGVMPAEASVYDFTKLSSEGCEEYEDDSDIYTSEGYEDWVKAHPQVRSGRRSMDVFLKSHGDKGVPKEPWSDHQPNEQQPKADDSLQEGDGVGDSEWVKLNPEVRSGRRSMDVLVKAGRGRHTPRNTWSEIPDDFQSAPPAKVCGPSFPDQTGATFLVQGPPTFSRFPDYDAGSHSSKSLSASFPDY